MELASVPSKRSKKKCRSGHIDQAVVGIGGCPRMSKGEREVAALKEPIDIYYSWNERAKTGMQSMNEFC